MDARDKEGEVKEQALNLTFHSYDDVAAAVAVEDDDDLRRTYVSTTSKPTSCNL